MTGNVTDVDHEARGRCGRRSPEPLGAFVGAMGVEPPVVEDALTGIGAAVGLVGAVIHAYLVGASGGTPGS